MASKRKKKVEVPRPPTRVGGQGRGKCIYCTRGYIAIGVNRDGQPITMECGYCLGTGAREIP